MNPQLKTDLRSLLSDITHEVLRNNPGNVIECVREYLVKLFTIRECQKEANKSVQNICDFASIAVDIIVRTKIRQSDVLGMLQPIFQDNSSIVLLRRDSSGESQVKSMELFLNDTNDLYKRQKSEVRKCIKEILIFYFFNDFCINTEAFYDENSTSSHSESNIHSESFIINKAATIVQAAFRGYITRKKLKKRLSSIKEDGFYYLKKAMFSLSDT